MADLASRVTQPAADDAPPAANPETNDADAGTSAGGPGLWDSEANVQVSLTDLQSDESTPFYSAKTFEDLKL